MTPLPGAPAPGADDLERRLAAALNPELNHLVADAAALRAHARAGSRRIRRRRRVAAGALTVVALGGLSALALPRHQDPSPVPLPVATPTLTPTGVTTQPSPSGTPTGTPSLQLSTTAPTASSTGSPSHTTQGHVVPQGTGTQSATTRPPAAAQPTTSSASPSMDPTYGA